MTSLFPTSHRVANVPDRLSAAATTMAEIYREAGYATLAYSSVPFTGQLTNLHQGYEELHERGSVPESGSKTAREYVDRFLGWLDRHPDTPFFTFLHVFDPHSPFEPRDPYNTMWADPDKRQEHLDHVEKVKPLIKSEFLKGMGLPRRSELVKANLDPGPFIEYDKDWYDGSIRGMDAEMGRVFERLRQLGQLENTVVAFFSDHGEEFQEHDLMFHGFSVYGEMTNVPFFLHWPGVIPSGLRIGETVRTIDMMPTVLELSGLPIPPAAQGKSLLPLIAAARGDADGNRDALLAASAALGWQPQPAISENVNDAQKDATLGTSLVSGGWRLIRNTRIPENDRPEIELFNHVEDPLCLKNVADEHPEIVERLTAEMAAWRENAEAAKLPDSDSTEGMSDEELKRLRSLGYIK